MLEVDGIDVFYGDLQALRGASFSVGTGEVVSIVGSNGAGKSTAVRTVSGLLAPRRGRIEFNGENVVGLPPSRIVKLGISQIPEGRQLFPTMTVLENLEMGAQFPHTRRVRRETMDLVFEVFPRLKERLGQKAGTLSGGEQQMLAIGRGLMARPKLLILDEPSLGLSPLLVSAIFDVIRRINEQGTSILLIEQNVFHALSLCRRAYVLQNGHVVLEGTGAELLENPEIGKTYLGL
ncbi:MAG: ABC transporter ATP-binding protein [Deltaproteobacteria bacterium]|nr:ABC transporter ATP-binding protein [Deltaproteobacteria bacterium]